ncbi:MAG: phosphatidate cytidylyltransferase [Saprospiraceae bacterium]|nr:phosphatidate cytidylyltransferase [Saprospiraceae bacterium]
MKDLRLRLIPALIAGTIALYALQWPIGMVSIIVFAAMGCALEMYRLSSKIQPRYRQGFLFINCLMLLYTFYYVLHHAFPELLPNHALSEIPYGVFSVYIILLSTLLKRIWLKKALPLINLIYPYIGLFSLVELCFVHHRFEWQPLVVLLLSIWAADAFAYFIGSNVKGPKLAPSISPNKTISGWIGGLAGIVLVSWLSMRFLIDWTWPTLWIWAPVIWLSCSMGDLFESQIKRLAGVKDSGFFLPGHGGFLDRLDSLLYSAPFAFFILYYLDL